MELEKRKIIEELDRVNASEGFRSKPVMRKLLAYLVNECIEGRSDHIKGYSIGLDVFGRGDDFDPGRSALVRNNAVRLRGLLKTYYLGEGARDPVVIEIPKGRYVPQFTSRGISGAREGLTHAPRTAADADRRPPGVAVLPFKNLSSDRRLDFLATGFPQALSDALTRFDDMRVIGMSRRADLDASATRFADEIRNKGVGFLVEGEIQAFDAEVKISFRLVNTADESQLWGDGFRFDMEKDNLFDVEERITGRIASLIGGEYGRVNQFRHQAMLDSRPRSLNEQEVLLKHYHHVSVLTEESMMELHKAISEALEREPDSALLNAIASAYYQNVWAFSGPDADEALQEFVRLIEKAYALNPNHQLVLTGMGGKCFVFDERDRFFELFERSKEWLANSPLRLGAWAMHICLFGEWERGKKLLDQVFENNVLVPLWLHGITFLYHYRLHDYETALVEANKYRIPGLFWGPAFRSAALGQLGRLDEAEEEYAALLECRPDFKEKGRWLMGCYIKETSLLEHVLDGFAKIGKTIELDVLS